MSLDITLLPEPCHHCGHAEEGWDGNITHNLTGMAEAAGIYKHLWRPEELFPGQVVYARMIVDDVYAGLKWLEKNETEARKHDSPNDWGTYDDFLDFVRCYYEALCCNMDAEVHTYR